MDDEKEATLLGQPNNEAGEGENKASENKAGEQQGGEGNKAGENKAGEQGDNKGEGAKENKAPEKYADFTLPEKTPVTAEQIADISAIAKQLNMTQEQAQELVNLHTKSAQGYIDAQLAAFKKTREGWVKSLKADKEIGGNSYKENVGVAVKALNRFGSKNLTTLLNESGLGDHPEMIRFFYKVGKAISEDKLIEGGAKDAPVSKPFYKNSNHVISE